MEQMWQIAVSYIYCNNIHVHNIRNGVVCMYVCHIQSWVNNLQYKSLFYSGVPGADKCFLCDNVMNAKFSPCGHVSMCMNCAPKALRCPLCKVSGLKSYHVYSHLILLGFFLKLFSYLIMYLLNLMVFVHIALSQIRSDWKCRYSCTHAFQLLNALH